MTDALPSIEPQRNVGADAAERRSVRGYLRRLAVIGGLLTVWLLSFVAFLSAYSDWDEPDGYTLIWSASLATIGGGGAGALIAGRRRIGIAVLVPLALFFVYVDGMNPI
jgi:hypothetical protein